MRRHRSLQCEADLALGKTMPQIAFHMAWDSDSKGPTRGPPSAGKTTVSWATKCRLTTTISTPT